MPFADHLIATTRGRALLTTESASWLWHRLRVRLAAALCCVLMPDHLHLLTWPGAQERLRRVLSAFTARYKIRFDLKEPGPANSVAIAKRMMRYTFYNPVRSGHVDDPWAWPWSTLRDLGGAAYPIWTPAARTAVHLGTTDGQLLSVLTTTADARPRPLERRPVHTASLDGIHTAIEVARRLPGAGAIRDQLGRRLMSQACAEIGPTKQSLMSDYLRVSERTIRQHQRERHAGVDPVLLCLGDSRLLHPLEDALG